MKAVAQSMQRVTTHGALRCPSPSVAEAAVEALDAGLLHGLVRVDEMQPDRPGERQVRGAAARELDLRETALRNWVRQAEIDTGRGTVGAHFRAIWGVYQTGAGSQPVPPL